MVEMIEKVRIEKIAIDVYNYNAQIWRSVDGGKTFWYCGCGKYFQTEGEAENYKKQIEEA